MQKILYITKHCTQNTVVRKRGGYKYRTDELTSADVVY